MLAALPCLLACAAAWGQAEPPSLPAAPPPALPATAPAGTNAAAREYSLKFEQAPVQQVLQYYSELTGRTLLQAPEIKGSISLRSQSKLSMDETLQALETVLGMNNITILKVGERFAKVVPITAARQEGMPFKSPDEPVAGETDQLISEILDLQHIDIAEAQKVIAGLLHPYGKVQTLDRVNAVLVTDTAANLNRIHEILGRVDQPLESREELRIIPILHTKASEIKKKIEEIIAETQAEKEKGTVPRPRTAGAPGFETPRPAVVAIPGVIRPPSRGPETTEEITSAERGIVIGSVKIVADDRTGILIIVTHPQNMKFFDNIVKALDVPTDPDVVVKVFRLEYSQAEEVAKMLNDLIGAKSAKAEEAPAGGAAAAAGGAETPEARSAALQDYIRRQAQAQAQKEASEAAAGKTKIGELSATNIKILSDKRSNALIIMASKSDMAALDEIIKDMDIMLSQVLIEAVVVEVTLSKRLETGFDWVQRSMIVFEQNADGSRSPVFSFAGAGGGGSGAPLDATTVVPSSSAGLTYYLTYFNLNMDAVLKMVASDSRAQVLQAPVILTTDNNKAVIDVSTEDYFYKGQKFVTTSSSGAGEWVDDVETKKVGLNLTVTPRINKKKFVVMELAQKISNVTDYRAIGNGQWPVVGSREFTASIAVRSGETIVLGGLVYDTSNRTRSKIPLLGDIPLLGLAFGSNLRGRQTTELIVFITPYVLDTPEEIMAEAQRRKGSLHVDGVWKRGWSSSKLAEPRPEDMDAPAAPATPTNAPVSPPAGLPE